MVLRCHICLGKIMTMQRIKYASYLITGILFSVLVWIRFTPSTTGLSEVLIDLALALIMLGLGQKVMLTLIALIADLAVKTISFTHLKLKTDAKNFVHSSSAPRSAYAHGRRSDLPVQRS
jgi:hypothetical protein